MGRNWRPRSVFICERCFVWRVRVAAPRCRCSQRLCVKVEGERLNDQMKRHLEKANNS